MKYLAFTMPLFLAGCSMVRKAHEVVFPAPDSSAPPEAIIIPDPQSFIIAKTWWLIPAAIVGFAGAAVLAVHGRLKTGLALAAGSGIVLWLSVSVFEHFKLIGYIGLAIPIGILGYAIYKAWADHKELELDRKAIPELVATTEATKNRLPSADAVELFGDLNDNGIAGNIQSPETEAIVKAARKKLDNDRI